MSLTDQAGLPDFPFRRGAHDRLTELRAEPRMVDRAWADPDTRVLVVDEGRLATRADHRGLEFVAPADAPAGERMLLGALDGTTYLLVLARHAPQSPVSDELEVSEAAAAGPRPAAELVSLRRMALLLGDPEASLAAHAVALANWHQRHPRCSACGATTTVTQAGAARSCPDCGALDFPRISPAVIMTVIDDDDRCLLAHNAARDESWYSTVAGFVDPGESAESAVAREVREETAIEVDRLTYLGSQPWPFPSELMLGFSAHARTTDITVDGTEITDARWFDRDLLRTEVEAGTLVIPTTVSISGALISRWYGGELPTRRTG